MLDTIIFTKDRPMQLDLLLRSIKDHFKEIDRIFILWKATNENYGLGYAKVATKFPGMYWFKETNFRNDVLFIIHRLNKTYHINFCDDDIVNIYVNLPNLDELFTDDVNAFSLNKGLNVNYCYCQDRPQVLPMYTKTGDIIKWNWQNYDYKLDWGYPMSLEGNIYRTHWIKETWPQLPFKSPNYLEGYMHSYAAPIDRPYQLAFTEQKIYNVANNIVQTDCKNRVSGNNKYSVENLNKLYLDGYVISTDNLYNKTFNSCNGEVEYIFVKD